MAGLACDVLLQLDSTESLPLVNATFEAEKVEINAGLEGTGSATVELPSIITTSAIVGLIRGSS